MKQLDIFSSSKESSQPHTWAVYIDGASRGNPGKAGAGIMMRKDGEIVCQEGFYLGIKTNNQAEYYALLLGLFFLSQYAHQNDAIRIASDSELLVKQIAGSYRVKNEGLQPLYTFAINIINKRPMTVMHVMRTDNTEADALANKGVDSKKPLPDPFLKLLKDNGISV